MRTVLMYIYIGTEVAETTERDIHDTLHTVSKEKFQNKVKQKY